MSIFPMICTTEDFPVTTITISKDLAKRQLAAARALLAWLNTCALNHVATVDSAEGIRRLNQLEQTSEDFAREIYTLDHEAS